MGNNAATVQPQPSQKAGLKCPQCGAFIETSILQLISGSALVCPQCHLRMNIDSVKSRKAIEVLRKVHTAQENLENKSHFRR